MTDKDIEDFIDYFGDQIPNPDQYPRRVRWLLKWYKYIITQKSRGN